MDGEMWMWMCVDLKWMLTVRDSFVCLLLGGSQNWGPTRWQVAGRGDRLLWLRPVCALIHLPPFDPRQRVAIRV